ncbi:hypothetical protein [Paraconexibacter algicola]|uniref:Uncharacterized protein n=1 Tax=Paraconexibacter algicola TaxID=2133960 RepID=A0A2T4UGE1_9ACTN|nr:hypothetical protein [Paraconexibacter algicola]PTL58277.1 hypothetical protein C7Y72_00745 [Paraconexibacter algicola]
MVARETRINAAVALAVAAGVTFAPTPFLRLFGIDAAEVTGAARFGWRLFAVRNVWVAVRALQGDPSATGAFLPVQLMDQVVFWQAYRARSVPRRAPLMAAATSGLIIALELRRTARTGR